MERGLTAKASLLLVVVASQVLFCTVKAQSSDFGMWYELGAEKKLTPHWNLSVDTEFRTRNNTRTGDRWSVSANAEYKILKGLKASTGYALLYDNNPEEFELKKDGLRPNKWTPSHWDLRHRFHLSLQGSIDWRRFTFSLRERWQYTYRPEAAERKYNFDKETWTSIKGKGKNVVRSRLQVSYDIPHWKFDPFASIEMFNDKDGIQKMRYQFGVDYKLKKKHVFSLTYRFQNVNENDDDGDSNSHLLGLSYKYKF